MLLLRCILLSIINVSGRAIKGQKDPTGLAGVGSQMLPAWEPSTRLDLSSPGPEKKGALAWHKSQFPW